MRLTNIGAVILPLILGLGILHPTLLAQEEGETQEGQQEQKVIKKTSEGQGERAGTKIVPLSNSLSSYRSTSHSRNSKRAKRSTLEATR
jgi:hypothetical protein